MGVMVRLLPVKRTFLPFLRVVILIRDHRLYCGGYESDGTHNIAKYWINGQETKLSDGTQDASANAMVVSNNDLYKPARIMALFTGKIIMK